MRLYTCLKNNIYKNKTFSIVPIRSQDRYSIMQWRNEQMYHLRQNAPLTKEIQDKYFYNVVEKLFDQINPSQENLTWVNLIKKFLNYVVEVFILNFFS